MDVICSGIVVYGGGDIVFGAKRLNQWIQWMQSHSKHSTLYLFAPRTMSPPPYITILLCSASTASSGLTFLYQR